jgi:hypothetical protein
LETEKPLKPARKKTNKKVVTATTQPVTVPPTPAAPVATPTSTPKPTRTSLLREQHTVQRSTNKPHPLSSPPPLASSKIRRSLSQQTLRDYASYILDLRSSSRPAQSSPRFKQLHNLYSSLERLNNLSLTAHVTYPKTVLPPSRSLDFPTWWTVRNRTRIDQEIDQITSKLLQAQTNRLFFFKPTFEKKWTPDSHLRFKKFNVQELKEILIKQKPIQMVKDTYRTNYRGLSVKESALNIEIHREVNQNKKNITRSNTFSGSMIGGRPITTTPHGFTLSSDPYNKGSSINLQRSKSFYIVDDERKKLYSSLICDELRSLYRSQPLYTLYTNNVGVRKHFFERDHSDQGISAKRDGHLTIDKSPRDLRGHLTIDKSPRDLRGHLTSDNKSPRDHKPRSRSASPPQQQKPSVSIHHPLITRSRRPLYQPSSTPNILSPVLIRPNADDRSMTSSSTTFRLLDSRVFVNFDPSLHQPKFRYVPTPSYQSLHHHQGYPSDNSSSLSTLYI